MSSRTWFITGASRVFGKEWAAAALDRLAHEVHDEFCVAAHGTPS